MEAIRYVVSSKYCGACHAGDAVDWPEFAKDCADGCKRAVHMYKVGQAVVHGPPMDLECFSEERNKDIEEMIKAGKSRVDACDKHLGHVRIFNKRIGKQFQVYGKKRNFVPPHNAAAACRV